MTHLTKLSLANRLIIGLATLGIVVFGVITTRSLKQELLPSTQVPTAVVTADYPGTSPQIMADEVSTPIERALTGISGVTKVESTSTNGQATITVQWDYGLDADKLVASIRSAVDSLKPTLPTDLKTDVITGSTDDIPVLLLAVSSDAGLEETSRLVENITVPDLTAVDGVRSVSVAGENTLHLVVSLRPAELRKHDLTTQAVTEVIRAQAVVTPAGSSVDKNTELAVEVGRPITSVKEFTAMQVPSVDGPMALGTLADVRLQAVDSTSIARWDGRPALSLAVLKETDADAVQISGAVNALRPELERKLGANATVTPVFDQAPLIEQSIHDLAVEGLLGLAFAVLIILIFLFSLRSTLITAISIPLSLMIAMIGLKLGDYSLNLFTLAALTVAVGRVVDDSIVVLENIKRRDLGHADLTPADIVASVKEVAGAVTASTLTTVAVFLPVAVVTGVVGELFRPFAITVAGALAASLLVSLTIVPVLAYWFLRRRSRRARAAAAASGSTAEDLEPGPPTAEETKVTRLQRGYLPVLRWGLRHPVITMALALLVLGGTVASTTLLKTDFLGSVRDQTTLSITQKLPAGTRLETTSRAATKLERLLAADPQVKGYLTTVGGSLIPGVGGTSNQADITVLLADGARADDVRPGLQEQLSSVPGTGEVTVSASDNSSTGNDLTVTVKGENADDLRAGAQQVERQLRTISGLTDVRSNLAEQRKVLSVRVDGKKAATLGFTQGEIGQAVSGALRGTQVGSVTLQGEQRDVLVRSQRVDDPSPTDVANLELPVSQLQQTLAQQKASDRLAKAQQALNDEQQAQADQAAANQRNELRDQRTKLADTRASTNTQLENTRTELRRAQEQLRKLQATPPPPGQGGSVSPGDLARQQQIDQLTGTIAQSQAAINQLQASIDQVNESLAKIDQQLADADEQARQVAEQRKKAKQLQDQQRALPDVRATPAKVKDVAAVRTVLAPTTVTQIDGTPSVTITATPDTSDLGALSQTISSRLNAMTGLPAGVTATLGGAAEDQREAFNQLGLAMLAAIGLVFVIMVGTFRSLIQPLILLVSIPFAATGAVAGLLLTRTSLGVPAMVGLLMLIGIVVTNAIVLIDLINQYRGRGQDLASAITDGARLRLRPILMTACATVFALIPMALGLTGGGAFISKPLAVVVIGGLVSSTVLTLLLVPVLYSLVERRGERRRLAAEAAGPDAPTMPGTRRRWGRRRVG